MRNLVLIILTNFVLCSTMSFAQTTQNVKGIVLDNQSEIPLIGATIELLGTDNGTVTDIDGYFRLEKIPTGRQAFRVSYLGYKTITLPNILFTAGKEVILDVQLEENIAELSEILVTAEIAKDRPRQRAQPQFAEQLRFSDLRLSRRIRQRYLGGFRSEFSEW